MSTRCPKSSHPVRLQRAQLWKVTLYWDGPWNGPMKTMVVSMEELAAHMGIPVAAMEDSVQKLEAVGALTRERVY